MENIYKRIQNIYLPGIITGVIIQLNWAHGLLIEKGLKVYFAQHWMRLIISGILGGLIFYSFVKLAEYFAQKLKAFNLMKSVRFYQHFTFCCVISVFAQATKYCWYC